MGQGGIIQQDIFKFGKHIKNKVVLVDILKMAIKIRLNLELNGLNVSWVILTLKLREYFKFFKIYSNIQKHK